MTPDYISILMRSKFFSTNELPQLKPAMNPSIQMGNVPSDAAGISTLHRQLVSKILGLEPLIQASHASPPQSLFDLGHRQMVVHRFGAPAPPKQRANVFNFIASNIAGR